MTGRQRRGDVADRLHRVRAQEFGADLYQAITARLARGEFDAGQYRRFGKGGREIWIQASYNPVLDCQGRPYKVVKFATDITAQKLQAADSAGQLAAIRGQDPVSGTAVPIGPGCRRCLRAECPQRSHPPIGRAVLVNERERGVTAWNFVGD